MKIFRSLAAVLFVFALGLAAQAQESGEVAGLRAKAVKGNGIAQYNLGLAYFDLKDYARANDYASKAYRNGFPPNIVGLREKLKKVGKWEPTDQ